MHSIWNQYMINKIQFTRLSDKSKVFFVDMYLLRCLVLKTTHKKWRDTLRSIGDWDDHLVFNPTSIWRK